MPAPSPLLSVRNLCVAIGGASPVLAVDNISFDLEKGKTLAIVGESGSGKSLTALALMGLLPSVASIRGNIFLNARPPCEEAGNNLDDTSRNNKTINYDLAEPGFRHRDLRGREISMVFQEPMSSLNPVMRIGHQLREAIIIHQTISRKLARQLALDWLKKVQMPEPEKIYERYPHELSGGQKQRVMIAMAMCNHPALLIADEPTTALDATVQQEIIRLMGYLQQEHDTSMIFITHDLQLAAGIADDVLVMYRGHQVEYGPVGQVLGSPAAPYTRALIACKPSPEKKGFVLPTISDYLAENENKALPAATGTYDSTSREPMLEIKGLNVWFPGKSDFLGRPESYFKAVKDVSFSVFEGEVVGLVGESGCGKSTLSRCLFGLIPAHSGSIAFCGRDLTQNSNPQWRRTHKDIQMIFQDPYSSLNPRLTIGTAIGEPLRTHNIVARGQLRQEVLRLLDLVQLPASAADRYPHQFSGGQRQRIGIARALALRPKLLICDESVSALDVSIQAQVLNLLSQLRQEFKLTYLFISHDLAVVHYFSDRIMVMQAGRIVETGLAGEVLLHPQQDYTRKLLSAMHPAE